MKPVIFFSTIGCCLLLSACKKDSNNFLPFSPVGFWRGSLNNQASIAMANLPDGSSSFYAMLTSLDTAVAEEKFYGRYTVKDGAMKAMVTDRLGSTGLISDTLTLETVTASSQSMTGILIVQEKFTDTTTGVLVPNFVLVKQ